MVSQALKRTKKGQKSPPAPQVVVLSTAAAAAAASRRDPRRRRRRTSDATRTLRHLRLVLHLELIHAPGGPAVDQLGQRRAETGLDEHEDQSLSESF